MIHNFTHQEARALEGRLLWVHLMDPAAKGFKLPEVHDITVYQNNIREEAQQDQDAVMAVIETLEGIFTRSDVAKRLPHVGSERVGSALRALKRRKKVGHPNALAQRWIAL